MNDTLGTERIVPLSLVFGDFPSLRSIAGPILPRPSLAERAEAAQDARRIMAKHLAQTRFKRALKRNTLPAINRVYQPRDEVLIWREKIVENRIGEWLGPHIVRSFDKKSYIVLVQKNADSAPERYNITQIKPFLQPPVARTRFLNSIYHAISEFTKKCRYVNTFIKEVINNNNPRAKSPEMKEAKSREFRDLL